MATNGTIAVPYNNFTAGKQHEVYNDKGLQVLATRYAASGEPYLEITNGRAKLNILVNRGHQIWHFEADDKRLGMGSIREEPSKIRISKNPAIRSKQYLSDYGAYLVHCIGRRMGCAEDGDDYATHQDGSITRCKRPKVIVGETRKGPFVTVVGETKHWTNKGDHFNYVQRFFTTLRAGSGLVRTAVQTVNMHDSPLEFMALEHLNQAVFPGSRIVYRPGAAAMRVRQADPGHIQQLPDAEREAYFKLKAAFTANPELHTQIGVHGALFPEIVTYVIPEIDDSGWITAAQVEPTGPIHLAAYRSDVIKQFIAWQRNSTPVQSARDKFAPTDVNGMIGASGKPEGYKQALFDQEVIMIPGIGGVETVMTIGGILNVEEARAANLNEFLN